MGDPVVDRVEQAQQVLRDLRFDAERCNERSALVLLALLDLQAGMDWQGAGSPMLRTVEIMDWLRAHYGKDYRPNTRETIRRQTLHQFVAAGLVVLNPDEPTPGLVARYAREREQDMLAVTLPDGTPVELTPGGQNVLLTRMVEEFCPRWTPGGHILYVGDAGREDPVFEQATLLGLGVSLDKHGKLPDLVVYLPDRDWLVLMEAASSHGPVDAKR